MKTKKRGKGKEERKEKKIPFNNGIDFLNDVKIDLVAGVLDAHLPPWNA